jgi:hypothetical protein
VACVNLTLSATVAQCLESVVVAAGEQCVSWLAVKLFTGFFWQRQFDFMRTMLYAVRGRDVWGSPVFGFRTLDPASSLQVAVPGFDGPSGNLSVCVPLDSVVACCQLGSCAFGD